MNNVLFLDIDGVLNRHARYENGYCGIEPHPVAHLNTLLYTFSDLKLVISSAWRYSFWNKDLTTKGFEIMLSSHGLNVLGRIAGFTQVDEIFRTEHITTAKWIELLKDQGLYFRAELIRNWVLEHNAQKWAVIDDLPVPIDNLIQTDSDRGLTSAELSLIINYFRDK